MTNNDLQNTTQKTKDRATRILPKTRGSTVTPVVLLSNTKHSNLITRQGIKVVKYNYKPLLISSTGRIKSSGIQQS
jgi:hypothetical protein